MIARCHALAGVLVVVSLLVAGCKSADEPPARSYLKDFVPAHSHNDELRARPLLDALAAGCMSIEVDVFDVDGELLVAYDRADVKPDLTLDSMYLKPLSELVKEHEWILPNRQPLILVVEFKGDRDACYAILRKQLEPYRAMLHRMEDGKRVRGPVRVVVSGKRPKNEIAASSTRLVDLDTQPGEFPKESSELCAVQSISWKELFPGKEGIELSPEERDTLKKLADRARQQGRLLRIYDMPDDEKSWALALDVGVGLVNTDKLAEFAAYFRSRR
jgi:hypothetical protein